MNCQKETARTILSGEGDYLPCTKYNQENPKKEIEEYVQDETLRKSMGKKSETEKNRERIEKWTAFVTSEISWMQEKEGWERLEWSVETMHWLLDVHFSEDQCRIEGKNIQQNWNMARKLAD